MFLALDFKNKIKILSVKRSIIIFVLIFRTVLSVAQINPENELDKKYRPSENSIFNSLNKKNEKSYSSSIEIKNGLNFCPTALFRSRVLFYYEREIYKGLVFNIGVGKAFGKDFLQYTYFATFNSGHLNNTLTPSDILGYSSFSGSSPYLSVHLRLYYSGKAFDGGYVDFNYAHERTDFLLNSRIYDWPVNGSRNGSFTMNAYNFGFGYTYTGGRKNNFIHEFFTSFGTKFFTLSSFERVDGTTSIGSPNSYYRKISFETYARIFPAVNFGYIFGFGF
ncbi:MAG: hypothetical protein H0U95_01405 [Bacteroidetes bacterium]|nr:hypothetical protein [Bacteroidota bacterium]